MRKKDSGTYLELLEMCALYDIERICNLLERKIMNATLLASPIISLSKGKGRNVALGFELLY